MIEDLNLSIILNPVKILPFPMPYEEQEWLEAGLISKDQFTVIDDIKEKRVFSITKELQAMLYIGVLLLATGAGIIIYNHISSIGHVIAIVLIAVLAMTSFSAQAAFN